MDVLSLMILLHIIDDFVLQPISLSKLKQKDWWIEECKKLKIDYSKYETDYITALLIHSLSWSIMIHLPIMFIYGINNLFVFLSILVNSIIHMIIDDLKANKKKINLDIDQSIHLLQIIITFIIFLCYDYYYNT